MPTTKASRVRSACDACHQSKTRCSRGTPCVACYISQSSCSYSASARLGRPKGSKNRRTLMHEKTNGARGVNNTLHDSGVENKRKPSQQGEVEEEEEDEDEEKEEETSPSDSLLGRGARAEMSELFQSDGSADYLLSPIFDLPQIPGDASLHTEEFQFMPSDYTAVTFPTTVLPSNTQALGTPESLEINRRRHFSGSNSTNPPQIRPPWSTPAPSWSTPESSTASTTPVRCSCLQQQVQLICQLEDLQYPGAKMG
ncbi:hypothetical protein F5Y19DRAFT_489127 [Xylariaceae sp. FL1651]|nr:hypothetical protein F5Y19DRAFT_489127 [Xylariaceae sp. FL1651]